MKIFGSPSRYYQGPGIVDSLGEILNPFGTRFFILADPIVLPIVQKRITESLGMSQKIPIFEVFQGECSYPEIFRLKARAVESAAHVVIGIGGGKAIDTAKALNIHLNLPVVIIPTIAASDAAGTHAVVVYDENHVKLETIRMREGISCILVDTEIIARAPTRFLLAGMGDTLSTKFEAEACFRSGGKNLFGATPSEIALPVGQLAYEIIRKYGEEAKASADRKEVTPALEKVIEANLLLSGLGGACGGVAAAHAIYSGFSLIEEMRHSLHGELVAFGVLAQLVLENREGDFIADLIRFYKRVGLPATLEQLGLREVNRRKIETVARKVCEKGSFIHNMPFPVDEQMVLGAILKANSLAKDVKG
jgi:glycerol dehydrogenase